MKPTANDKLQTVSNQLSFFVDCYFQENKPFKIEKLNTKNVEFFSVRYISDELLFLSNGLNIDKQTGSFLRSTLSVYRKEKEVKIFLFGLMSKENTTPLFIFKARLNHDENIFSLLIDFDSIYINVFALECCIEISKEELKKIEEELYLAFSKKEFSKTTIIEVLSIFDKYKIPYNFDSDQTKTNSKLQFENLIGYGIFRRSKTSRGVKIDLKELEGFEDKEKQFSGPLKSLFTTKNKNKSSGSNLQIKYLPFTLSYGQYKIFESLRENCLSVLIGPPGTGKTFTLVTLALEAIRIGNSILICTKTEQALDVIEKKLKNELENEDLILRVGKTSLNRKLNKTIKDFNSKKNIKPISSRELKRQRTRAGDQFRIIRKLEKEIESLIENEEKFGSIEYKEGKSIIDKINRIYLSIKLPSSNKLATKIRRLRKLYKARYIVNKQLVNTEHNYRIFKNYKTLKENLSFFRISQVARNSEKQEKNQEKVDFKKLTNILPIWLVSLSDLNKSLPLDKEMFDILFIDEASQCEVTLAIPALQRAKKAVIAGDPKQLNHISFLTNSFVEQTKKKYGITNEFDRPYFDYRRFSLLDMADQVTFNSENVGELTEHYRCQPSIIAFNNDYFYSNRLRIMTSHGSHKTKNNNHIVKIEGNASEENVNKKEIDYIFEQIKQRYFLHEKSPSGLSIGIISPFRNQVDKIKKRAQKEFNLKLIERHNLLIGTPFEFQGEERDIIYISMAASDNSSSGSFAYLSRENVLNVATSRARSQQYIVHSFGIERLAKGGLLKKYLTFNSEIKSSNSEAKDVFARELIYEIQKEKEVTISQEEVISGVSIDILIQGEKNDLCIDLIGYQGAYDNVLNLEEIESLFRANKHVFVLPYRLWQFNKKSELKRILDLFDQINN